MSAGATYRIQFREGFPFEAALPLAPYLQRLGVTHLYASPIFTARAGSLHGYDVIDPTTVNPELGGEEAFRNLAAELKRHDLGLILDIVPNHMAADTANRWWMDVLRHGLESALPHYFDIDWQALNGKVLLPILGRPYWQCLDAHEITVCREETTGSACVCYFDWRLPLRPEDREASSGAVTTPAAVHEILQRQHYRLTWWRTANDTINWRRFFDVSDLVALRQEADDVFETTHAKVFEFYGDGLIDGVRVDHVDGLANPGSYCRRLRKRLEELSRRRSESTRPYVVVEKILAVGETLPSDWDVDGTTGYDFMNEVSALQHCKDGAATLSQLWQRTSGRSPQFDDEEILARGQIAQVSFESALGQTAGAFYNIAEQTHLGRDISLPALRRALVHVLQHLRVYRTYLTGHDDNPGEVAALDRAKDAACRAAGQMDGVAIQFVAGVMYGRVGDAAGRQKAVCRFNHLSAPVAAKAVEDTAFYRYGRLLSRNDVGFNPGTMGPSTGEFHTAQRQRAEQFPRAMLATATHDHKRGEDARARLAVLSECPKEWEQVVEQWFAANAAVRPAGIDTGDEYQLYQTLVGAWPLDLNPRDAGAMAAFCERILGWQQKALREAKLRTSWLDPDEAYENASAEFVRTILDTQRSREFLRSIAEFVARIAPAGALNGLVQTALRCIAPGVPDCYQGTEFWDFSLVDPDNRRPVDYAARIAALQSGASPASLLPEWRDGRVKQALIAKLLNRRKEMPRVFSAGTYRPLLAEGARAAHILAFARSGGDKHIIVAVPLHCANACTEVPLPNPAFWEDTQLILPEGLRAKRWRSVLDEQAHSAANPLFCRDLFARFPVVLASD